MELGVQKMFGVLHGKDGMVKKAQRSPSFDNSGSNSSTALPYRKSIALAFVILTIGVLTHCVQDTNSPRISTVPLQTQIVWTEGSVTVNPVAVEYIRLTVISECAGNPVSKTFPYSAGEGVVLIKTGCDFTLLCEGLDTRGRTLYKGERNNIIAEENTISVRITAEMCTPAPPDSLQALPSGRSVKLIWKDQSNNEAGFIIKRIRGSIKENKWTILDTVTAPFFIDTFMIDRTGVPYNYLVYSYNAIGCSVIPDSLTGFSLGTNNSPQFISTASDMDSIAEVDSIYTDTIRYRDPDFGDSLFLVCESSPDGFVMKDSVITWIPKVSQEGQRYTVRAIVTDQDSSRDTLIWSIRVKDTLITTLPPVFVTKALDLRDSVFGIGDSYRGTVKAIDPENGPIIYLKHIAPTTATVDSITGEIVWLVDLLGSQILFSVIATDTTNLTDTLSWTLSVY